MFFILRMVFWIAVVALLLPASLGQHGQNASLTSAGSLTARAASAALSYCGDSPGKCVAGLEGARRLADLLTEKTSAAAVPAAQASQRVVMLPPRRPALP
jgi:hypothetical protein